MRWSLSMLIGLLDRFSFDTHWFRNVSLDAHWFVGLPLTKYSN